jgi:hypothetical protein
VQATAKGKGGVSGYSRSSAKSRVQWARDLLNSLRANTRGLRDGAPLLPLGGDEPGKILR